MYFRSVKSPHYEVFFCQLLVGYLTIFELNVGMNGCILRQHLRDIASFYDNGGKKEIRQDITKKIVEIHESGLSLGNNFLIPKASTFKCSNNEM